MMPLAIRKAGSGRAHLPMTSIPEADRCIGLTEVDGPSSCSMGFSEDRLLVDVPDEVGSPDGLTVDAEGDLWVAIYGGGRVQRYAPDGRLREEVFLPAEQTTCCAFAGPGLHRLYVTTATENWTDEQRSAEPGAGLVYMVQTDATGQPAAAFRPDQGWWAAVIS
jgi:sugar lactone lactonase YvrE